MLMLETCRR